jgi:hypothetical protein
MSFLINHAREVLSLRGEASALQTLGNLVVHWDSIQAGLRNVEPAPQDIFDVLILLHDRLGSFGPALSVAGIDLQEVTALSARLKERYESTVPEPVRKLLHPVNAYTGSNAGEDSGMVQWKFLELAGQSSRKLGTQDVALALTGSAGLAVELEAGDELPIAGEDNVAYFRLGFNGSVKSGARVGVPFQYGSINLGTAAEANVDLDYWHAVAPEDLGSPMVLAAAGSLNRLANPFDLGSMWSAMCRTNSSLKAVRLLTEFDHESSIGLKFGTAFEMLENDMADATFEFSARVSRERRFETFVYSDGDGGERHLVALLKRRKDRNETSTASLRIGIDLEEVAGQAREYLKGPMEKYASLVKQYEKYLTPGTLLRTELSGRLDELLDEALAGKPELKRLALSLTGDVDELEALKRELTGKVAGVFDSGLGLFSREADEVVEEIVGRINDALPADFGNPAAEQAKSFLTDVIDSIKERLAGEVEDLISGGGAELSRVTDQLEKFHADIGERIDKRVARLDKVLLPVRNFLARVDGKIEKITKALDKAAKSRLTVRFWDENSLKRSTSVNIQARFLDNGDANRSAYEVITRGDFEGIEKLFASPPEHLRFDDGDMTYFIQRHQGSGVEIGLMDLDVGAESIFDSRVKVTLDIDGNLIIKSSLSASRQLRSVREMQEVSFLSPFDLNVARHTRNMRTQLVLSQDDKNLKSDELADFLQAFSKVGLLSDGTVLNASNQLKEWRAGGARKDVKARVDVSLALDNESLARLFEENQRLSDEELIGMVAEALYDAEVFERGRNTIERAARAMKKLTRVSGEGYQVYLSVQPTIPKSYGSLEVRKQFMSAPFGTTHQARKIYPLAESSTRKLKQAFAVHMYCKGFAVMLDTLRAVYNVSRLGKSGQDLANYLDEQNQLINLCLRRWLKVGQKFLWMPSDDAAEETIAFFLLFARIAELDSRTDDDDSIMSVTMTLSDADGGQIKAF